MALLSSSGNVALSVLMTAASTLSAVVGKLVLLSYPMLSSFKLFVRMAYLNAS